MMKKIVYISLTLIVIGLSACDKDYLDVKPTDSYTEINVYQDLALAEMFLSPKYRLAFEKFPWIFGFSASCDEAYSQWNWFSEDKVTTGTITPDVDYMGTPWNEKYSNIRDLNNFIERIGSVPGDSVKRDRIKGEAIFLRAYFYFDLVRRYGGVPLITTAIDPNSNTKVDRSTYDQCAQFIIDELDKSTKLLPLTYNDANLGRITKGASMALKARMLLYWASPHNNKSNDASRWKAASKASKDVIDLKNEASNVYSLYQPSDYRQIFLTDFNSEIILARMQSAKYDEDNDVDLINSPSGYLGWSTFEPTQEIVNEFEMSNGKMIGEAGSGYDAAKPYANRDKRFYANIVYDGGMYRGREVEAWIVKDEKGEAISGGRDSKKGNGEYWNYSKTGYCIRKYTEETRDLNIASARKPVLFRLTEMYLNYAEAENMLGNDDEARTYLNLVRTRTGVEQPAIANSVVGTELRDKIRHERKIELMFENQRFFDIRRWDILLTVGNVNATGVEITKKEDGTKTYEYIPVQTRKAEDKHYLFPIPKSEILRVDIQQNPGY